MTVISHHAWKAFRMATCPTLRFVEMALRSWWVIELPSDFAGEQSARRRR